MCRSPELIAACHVLLRLLMPRHSPCALFRLTSSAQAPYRALRRLRQSLLTPLRLLFLADLHPLGGRRELRAHVRYWFSELCRLIQDHLLRNCFTHYSSTILLLTFPSVALLVFPLFSFQCAERFPEGKRREHVPSKLNNAKRLALRDGLTVGVRRLLQPPCSP